MRKVKYLIVAFISVSLMFSLLPISAIDYANEEAKYSEICSNPTKDNKEICRGFQTYLRNKEASAKDKVNEYKGQINKYQDDLSKQVEIAKGFEAKIEEVNIEINQLYANIEVLENNIETIEAEIIAREEEIKEKDRIIVERMRKTQSDMRFGYEIDFLIKARDFSTLIASASVVNDIMSFEAIQIEEINGLIAKQKEDQDAIVLQQEAVETSIVEAENKKADVITLKAEVDEAIANYQVVMAEIAALQSQATADASAIKDQLSNVVIYKEIEDVQTSGGFVRPIAGGYLSATVWEYPNGWGMHLGNDYAAPVGTPIRAAANGVVLASYDTCPTYGGLGNGCGVMRGGGNQVYLLVTVDNQLYGATYFHMQSGSPIKSGQTVTAGQLIGRLGTSGNSSGPHVHAEVYYLGDMSINEYIAKWSRYPRLDHGVGMTSLANRCDFNGYRAPCRMNPNKAYGSN